MSYYEVRLPDGRAFFESDAPLAAARQWVKAESKAHGSIIHCKTALSELMMEDAITCNKGRLLIELGQNGMQAKDKDEAAEIVSKAVRHPD